MYYKGFVFVIHNLFVILSAVEESKP